jgi:hypothetical protein
VAQTEEGLRAAATINLGHALRRVATSACQNARIAELTRALSSGDGAWQGTTGPVFYKSSSVRFAFPRVVAEPKGNYGRTAWEIANAQGALIHLPRAELLLYAREYRDAVRNEDLEVVEADLEARLGGLAFDGPLSREQRAGYLTVLSQLDSVETRIASRSQEMVRDAAALKLKPQQVTYDDIAAIRAVRGACVRDINYPPN